MIYNFYFAIGPLVKFVESLRQAGCEPTSDLAETAIQFSVSG